MAYTLKSCEFLILNYIMGIYFYQNIQDKLISLLTEIGSSIAKSHHILISNLRLEGLLPSIGENNGQESGGNSNSGTTRNLKVFTSLCVCSREWCPPSRTRVSLSRYSTNKGQHTELFNTWLFFCESFGRNRWKGLFEILLNHFGGEGGGSGGVKPTYYYWLQFVEGVGGRRVVVK